ncbi:MAG TPA: DNA-formamidopyrimidine glycosylase family protein, partial [Pseudobdellovibrionaceae bacterium]|nr:DNA-formamidopyrimidine glycosylase family protein [Pseudobdellovibrionaceae bacterium]
MIGSKEKYTNSSMPELPEVECLRISLEKIIQPQTRIQSWKFHRSDLRLPIPIPKLKKTEGHGIISFHRRAKYLLIELDGKWIISHLGMSGNWRKQSEEARR